MMKKLMMVTMLMVAGAAARADFIPMTLKIDPDFGFIGSTEAVQVMDIAHTGTNCKYLMTFRVFSNLGDRWGLEISAPQMVSADGKDKIDRNLFNYKIFGGVGASIPAQQTNGWEPLPTIPNVIYLSDDTELFTGPIEFKIFVFVTPKTAQMQKTYRSRVTVRLVQL